MNMSVVYGMAVLGIRILFVVMSYRVLCAFDWHRLLRKADYSLVNQVVLLLSLALGHLTASFVIEIIELMRNVLLTSFL